ncbi:hypothetical protein OG411_32685 [Streptomyces pseudogriseolus]|uniref:Uncharacterized protein n=1 Tax=Streptomyces sp. R17 TaxID=3238626 RepID=A0AB39NYF7_9ACTN
MPPIPVIDRLTGAPFAVSSVEPSTWRVEPPSATTVRAVRPAKNIQEVSSPWAGAPQRIGRRPRKNGPGSSTVPTASCLSSRLSTLSRRLTGAASHEVSTVRLPLTN